MHMMLEVIEHDGDRTCLMVQKVGIQGKVLYYGTDINGKYQEHSESLSDYQFIRVLWYDHVVELYKDE